MPKKKVKEFNNCLLYILITFMVLTGTINTAALKMLMKQTSRKVKFEQHQFFMTTGMFVGELMSMFGYIHWWYTKKKKEEERKTIDSKRGLIPDDSDANVQATDAERGSEAQAPKEEEEEDDAPKKPQAKNYIFALSASCDLVATTLGTFGLTFLTSSIYQMMRGIELLWVMIFSRIFLKNPIYRHHLLGIGCIVFGLTLVGIASFSQGAAASDPVLGICLLMCSQLVSSTCYTVQEFFVKRFSINTFQLVGWEGFWGLSIYIVILCIFSNISCDSWSDDMKKKMCIQNDRHEYSLEDALFAFRQLGSDVTCLCLQILYVSSIAAYNFIGINLTQLVSSLARAVVDTVRTVFIWTFFLIPFSFVPPDAKETFTAQQFIGFLFLLFGSFTYNEIIEIKFFNMNYYTRRLIAEREKARIAAEEEGQAEGEQNHVEGDTEGEKPAPPKEE